ncbi:hypothetical protein IW261DRAFT_523946 [Armillaria novae-zelandiae]|uniref:Secreted protein n=1 Tax=Armillaria novae-zelandiae TaxID=153914 RepID=A0AA39U5J0_9AGAR|nr:hypothetical protein IW261DRAFT_523946 [Armillaria novae-zelandiae]
MLSVHRHLWACCVLPRLLCFQVKAYIVSTERRLAFCLCATPKNRHFLRNNRSASTTNLGLLSISTNSLPPLPNPYPERPLTNVIIVES